VAKKKPGTPPPTPPEEEARKVPSGHCKIEHPHANAAGAGEWPMITLDCWCGEWKKAK